MKRLFSVLFACALMAVFVAIGPSAGADKKYIYEADLFDAPFSPTSVRVDYAHVSVDSDYNVEVEVKTNQTNSRLGVSLADGFAPFRHGVYLGEVPTDEDGEGKALFNLRSANIDFQIPGSGVIEPAFRLFSFESETGVPNAQEAATAWPVYPVPPAPSANGTISIATVLPDGYAGEVPVFDLSWVPYPFHGTPVTFENLVPRYYAITRIEPPIPSFGLVFDKVTVNDPNADSFILGPPVAQDRTLIVNLGPGQTVTVTYYYKYK
jgi:hypothetical protein